MTTNFPRLLEPVCDPFAPKPSSLNTAALLFTPSKARDSWQQTWSLEKSLLPVNWKRQLVWTNESNLFCSMCLGSFGRVMLAKNRKTGEFYAMKRLKKSDIIKLRQVDHVISENTILADIDHPFLVSFSPLMANNICCFFLTALTSLI